MNTTQSGLSSPIQLRWVAEPNLWQRPVGVRDPQRGLIHDLRGYNRNDQTRSLKNNRNDCG